MENIRKPIGNSLRFKVFKRDNFSCQYCGATPPTVILEVDHINPVANGGKNNIDNLATACFNCNRGKHAGLLTDVPKTLHDKSLEIKEREAQLKGYTKILQAKADRIEADTWTVAAALKGVERAEEYDRRRLQSIRLFLNSLDVFDVVQSAEIATSKFNYGTDKMFRYFCGICWRKIKEANNG